MGELQMKTNVLKVQILNMHFLHFGTAIFFFNNMKIRIWE